MDDDRRLAVVRHEGDFMPALTSLGLQETAVIPTIDISDVLEANRPRWEEEFRGFSFQRTEIFTNGQRRALKTLKDISTRYAAMAFPDFIVTIADPTRALFQQCAEHRFGEGASVDPDPFRLKIQKIFDVIFDQYPYFRGFSTMLTRFTATSLGVPYQPDRVRSFARSLVVPDQPLSTAPSRPEHGGLFSIFRGKER